MTIKRNFQQPNNNLKQPYHKYTPKYGGLTLQLNHKNVVCTDIYIYYLKQKENFELFLIDQNIRKTKSYDNIICVKMIIHLFF